MMRVKAESQALWLQGQAEPEMTQVQENREHCGQPWPRPCPPLSPSCASEHFLPLSFYQQIQSLIKGQGEKRGREERGDREVKRAREIDVCVGGERGENNKPFFI